MTTIATDRTASTVDTLKLLASETRFKIIELLLKTCDTDICVKEISDAIGVSHSATSHQLAKLESGGLVKSRRDGQTICYKLTDCKNSNTVEQVVNQFNK